MSIKDRLMTYAEVLEHEPMKKHTTFKIGGCVDYYIYPKNCTALMCVLEILAQKTFHIMYLDVDLTFYVRIQIFMVQSSI